MLWLFLVAMVIDGTDGMLARRFSVKAVLPGFDGALLDNIVDYMTYALAPMVLLWANGYLPDGAAGGVVAAMPLLASMLPVLPDRREDRRPLLPRLPAYWNIVAFYASCSELSTVATTALLLVLCGAGVRADQVPLPVAHGEALVRST